MRNNDVYQVLVTKDNQAVLPAGKSVTDLKPGQIGVFNYESNKSIDGTEQVRNFYLAVGVDTEGAGELTDIRKSAGSHIQGRNIVHYSVRPYQESKPQIFEIKGFEVKCGESYGLAIEVQSETISRTIGSVRYRLPFVVDSNCCEGCGSCESGDANEVVRNFYESIKLNSNGLVKVEMIDPTGKVVEDYEKFVKDNLAVNTDKDASNDVVLGLRITAIPEKVAKACGFNKKYISRREVFLKVYGTHGFECNTLDITETQKAQIEQGAGYDIKQLEYVAGGWNENPGPYRMVAGFVEDTNYLTDVNGKYTVVALTYDEYSISGWLNYLHNEASVIAIPKDDTTTLSGLTGILDKLVEPLQFDALTDDTTGYTKEDKKKDGLADSK